MCMLNMYTKQHCVLDIDAHQAWNSLQSPAAEQCLIPQPRVLEGQLSGGTNIIDSMLSSEVLEQ
jgi:hypothetical protein